MNDPSESGEPGQARSRLSIAIALSVVVALCALLAWWLKPPERPAAPAVQATPEPGAGTSLTPPATAAPAPPVRPRRRESKPEATKAPVEPVSVPQTPKPPTLRVTSDVAGALVFVDRKFLGKTPLETDDVQLGSHRLQVSAEGYDGVSQSIEIAHAGPTDVSVSLKTVVLDAHVPVVHKHRFGSCEGSLVADVRGLRFETSNTGDAWRLPFSALETFSVDYKSKTLQIKQREGRSWNFTTRTSNADPLLVFQREVDHARSRLAQKRE